MVCGKPFAGRRDALYDSVACKSVAYRSRKATRLHERRNKLDKDELLELQAIRDMSQLDEEHFDNLIHRLIACHDRDAWLDRLRDLRWLLQSKPIGSGLRVIDEPLF